MQVLALSLLAYKRGSLQKGLQNMHAGPQKRGTRLSHLLSHHVPVLMFYTPVHAFAAVVVLSAFLLPLNYWLAAWGGGLTVYYLLTAPGSLSTLVGLQTSHKF